MDINKELKKASQKELMTVLGVSRPLISELQNGKRVLTDKQQNTLTDYFNSLQDANSLRINLPQKNLEKFKQTFIYLISKVGAKPNVGQTVLYKLLYFIDFDYYEKYEEQLMGLTYIKNQYGPTPREFKKVVEAMQKDGLIDSAETEHFSHTQKKYFPVLSPNLSKLSGQEVDMIDSVIKRYSDLSASQLSDLSHQDTPWQMADDKDDINYEYAFYRPERFSVREYSKL
jgi:uncharacterized phage-associated protein